MWLPSAGVVLASAILVITLSPPVSTSTEVAPVWSTRPGGSLADVAVDRDGDIFVTGTRVVNRQTVLGTVMIVAKYHSDGTLIWKRSPRREGSGWHGNAVAAGPGGGVYVGGAVIGPHNNAVVWHYSAAGRLLWRRMLRVRLGEGQVTAAAADDHGVVVTVETGGTGCDNVKFDGSIRSLRRDGTTAWTRNVEAPHIQDTWDSVGGIAIGPDGRVYVAGWIDRRYWAGPDQPRPDQDVLIQQLSRAGMIGWTRVLGDGRTIDAEHATAVDARAGLLVATGSIDNLTTGWVGAFTPEGVAMWSDAWVRGYSTCALDTSIAPWGAVYVVGDYPVGDEGGEAAILRRYGTDGALAWERPLGAGSAGSVATSADALYLTIGGRLERWPVA